MLGYNAMVILVGLSVERGRFTLDFRWLWPDPPVGESPPVRRIGFFRKKNGGDED